MLEFYFEVLLNMLQLLLMHVAISSTLGQPSLASIVKRQVRDRYGRFTSPSSCTTPPSSIHRRTAPPPSSDDSSVEMRKVPPPHPTRLDDSSSTSSSYNNECSHVKEVSSYELILDFNCLV
jgi:hypothetical protein